MGRGAGNDKEREEVKVGILRERKKGDKTKEYEKVREEEQGMK